MNKLKSAVCSLFALTATTLSMGQVVISQYYEGNVGSNRLLEIWNFSASAIDFSINSLSIANFTNGSSTASSTLTISTGTLASGSVLVIANTDSTGDAAIAAAGITVFDTTNSAINFNGDDAIQLSLGGVVKDIIGQIGLDPGSAWTASGVSTANQNISLVSSLLTTGDTNGSDAYDPSVRYLKIADADVTSSSLAGFGIAPAAVPEPTTYALIAGMAVLGGCMMQRRRRNEVRA